MNTVIQAVTARIIERSKHLRQPYIAAMKRTMDEQPPKKRLSCGNLAHAYAACSGEDKNTIRLMQSANISITTAYNDMLSAHQPYETYPDIIKETARAMGSTAQIAGGVPAMCDGVTQGLAGMELSLFSREIVAMSAAVGLSHNMFDGNAFLGVCDKIVPGMVIAAATFGHLPAVFIPAGPMSSGISNKEKAKVRQQYAAGEVGDERLLEVESKSYHSPGTCTFYGTANSNQMLVEMLGVQLPGSSFVAPNDPLRDPLTRAAIERLIQSTLVAGNYTPVYEVLTEESYVNAVVGLLATGGSTNHTMHLVAMARASGIILTWEDMDELSRAVPLIARVYPNGEADVNRFHEVGGMAYLIKELRLAGMLNENVKNIMGEGLDSYEKIPSLDEKGNAVWLERAGDSKDDTVLRPASAPFDTEGGLRLLSGNLGQGVIKISAVAPEFRVLEAPCIVFDSQDDVISAFKRGELERDFIAVVRFQGPRANGMPELHKMTPPLGLLQDRGFKVALVTDGRMSGASGKVPSAIHMSPEALYGGLLAKVQTGDVIYFDAEAGVVELKVSEEELASREVAMQPIQTHDLGRNLFGGFRLLADRSQDGASVFNQFIDFK
ncbi:MAG: phosphogluconate dehydratase [Marinagarivorans sp.]|nr:phosphogluconate dehydratase [Marinagarivorans sp.]